MVHRKNLRNPSKENKMPVTYNESKSKWCMGENCNYDTKEKAEAAERAYYASMNKESINICNTNLMKSVDEEKRLFKSVILRPNQYDDDGKFSDFYSEEVVEKACHDFNLYCQQGNLGHIVNTDLIKFVESYISDVDYSLGDGEIKKGDWIGVCKIFDDS